MKTFNVGDKAIVINVSGEDIVYLNETVTVINSAGYEEDDGIAVTTKTGQMLKINENQLKKI